jgi:Histidine kinase-, DNA gyrase B-, and HSP90-like ATPase
MSQFNHPNDPNPARLIESLRHVGYGNYEAIADIVDNCFDAEATSISIKVAQYRGDFHIVIADNGSGMDHDTLDEALRMGSLTERNITTDLGKFGMGLVTAGLSLSRRTHVVTKQGDEYWTSIADVDEVLRTNTFCKHLAPSAPDERQVFDEVLGPTPSGTIVTLTKTDGLTNKNVTQFANILRKHLGEVHRYFLLSGKTILINDEPTPAIDPLQLDQLGKGTEMFSDEPYPIQVEEDGESTTYDIRVRIALIPDNAGEGDLEMARGLQHQGFYVLRNNRQIYRAQTLGFFTKHNDFNRMRGEIFFPGNLDKLVGIEFTKRQVTFDQSIQDKLSEHLKGQCRTIKRRMSGRESMRTTPEHQQFHEQASKAITEKSRLLITPKAVVEKRSAKTKKGVNGRSPERDPQQERRNFQKAQKVHADLRCQFLHQQLGPNGQIFECDLEGRTVIIRWNVDHPFFRRFVVDNQDDGRLVTAVDFLVYSMACAELRARDEENVQFINNMKAVISANLRTLLS